MAGPLLLRQVMLLRFRLQNYQRFAAGTVATPHRLWCSAATDPDSGQADEKASSVANTSNLLRAYSRFNEPDYRKWKDTEEEILGDIEPIIMLTKEILHSRRYMDGEQLTIEDEKAVVEKLLAYHPHSEDKIGCGLESIMGGNYLLSLSGLPLSDQLYRRLVLLKKQRAKRCIGAGTL